MNLLTLQLDTSKKPFYLRLTQAIINSIKDKQILAGEKLPTARALATHLNVNRHTIMRGYAELIAQGWVENFERSHYRVSAQLPIIINKLPESLNTAKQPFNTSIKNEQFPWQIRKNIPDSNFIKSTGHFKYSFAGGKPDMTLFPFDEYRSHINDALKRPKDASLHYGDNQGDPKLIEQGLVYLRRTRNLINKELIITNGSQEALYLISQLLLHPGDKVAVEALGYPPAWQAFQTAGAQLISIEQDEKGISIDCLKEMASKHQLKCIYLTPLHQYPTTVTLTPARRADIYEIARQYQLFIIEDDYDHEYHYTSQPIAPIAANDPDSLVIYLSSFSKIMFPGARAGMLAVPPAILKPLVNFRTTVNHKPAIILQDALARWISSGGFERHIRRSTKAYLLRYKNALSQLQQARDQGAQMHCLIPDGGMALWVKTQVNTQQLAKALAAKSIYIQHQQEFCIESQSILSDVRGSLCLNHFRLGFAGQPIEHFNTGFNVIVNLVLELQSVKPS
jgi:GntR family transcriptional regulator/MocR family aminotransferase